MAGKTACFKQRMKGGVQDKCRLFLNVKSSTAMEDFRLVKISFEICFSKSIFLIFLLLFVTPNRFFCGESVLPFSILKKMICLPQWYLLISQKSPTEMSTHLCLQDLSSFKGNIEELLGARPRWYQLAQAWKLCSSWKTLNLLFTHPRACTQTQITFCNCFTFYSESSF